MKSSAPQQNRLKVRLTPAAERAVRGGHPWVFADRIRELSRTGNAGDLAVVYDRHDRFLAIGLYDPESPIALRILHAGKPVQLDQEWWRKHLDIPLRLRTSLFDDATTGYRCVNGESDGWPGLVLDRYASCAVLKIYTAAWLPHLERVVELIEENLHPTTIVLRLSRNIQTAAANNGLSDGQVLRGAPVDGPVVFRENGKVFEADVIRGQKTGFFLDQRENRKLVGEMSVGRDVLNVFSHAGGFSVYAAAGGATSTTDLDISGHALAAAKRNFELNRADDLAQKCRHETVQADAFDWLEKNSRPTYDMVIIDPPSLAKRESEKPGALAAYERLATAGANLLRADGVLVAASCSAHVKADEFFQAVRMAARRSRHSFVELRTTRHAPDHPARIPEAEYLKCIYLQAVAKR
ncbi:methyltransferase [bacterium]|nr:methyltransferase [bacterium]